MNRIGILRGGTNAEYHLSLATGASIQRAVLAAGFDGVDILIDTQGVLHVRGVPTPIDVVSDHVDIVWNALHGDVGEDGTIQTILRLHGIPYFGSDAAVAELLHNKKATKEIAEKLGIPTPIALYIDPRDTECGTVGDITQRAYRTMAPPWVVKPVSGGASIHAHFALTPLDLTNYIQESVERGVPFLIEQYIFGREVVVGTIDQFRGAAPYVLPVVEVRSAYCGILEHSHRNPQQEYARLRGGCTDEERKKVSALAVMLHEAYGALDYIQSEFIIDKQGTAWFIESDAFPHLHTSAPFLIGMEGVGASLQELAQSMVQRRT